MKSPNTYLVKDIILNLSSISLAILGFYLLLKHDFKKHPYPLIAISCLFESLYFANYTGNVYITSSNIVEIYHLTKIMPRLIWENGLAHFIEKI